MGYSHESTPGFAGQNSPRWLSVFSDFATADDINLFDISVDGTTVPAAPSAVEADKAGGIIASAAFANADNRHLWQTDEVFDAEAGTVWEATARFTLSDFTGDFVFGFTTVDDGDTDSLYTDLTATAGYGFIFRIDNDDLLDCTVYNTNNGDEIEYNGGLGAENYDPETDVLGGASGLTDDAYIELQVRVYWRTTTMADVVFIKDGDIVAQFEGLIGLTADTLCGTWEYSNANGATYHMDYLGFRGSIQTRQATA